MKLKRLPDNGDVARIEVAEEVVQGNASLDLAQISHLLGDGGFSQPVLLSLTDTEFIDSSGICWLLACHKGFSEAGGRLVIHSVPPNVLDTLKMMRLESILQLADDESEALQLVRGGE